MEMNLFSTFYQIEWIIFVYLGNFNQPVFTKFFLYGLVVVKKHFYSSKELKTIFAYLFSLSVSSCFLGDSRRPYSRFRQAGYSSRLSALLFRHGPISELR